jgi:nicotinate-nucleotide adenylyltransferase
LLFAEQAREQLDLERVHWVPAGRPWRKTGRAISPAKRRLEMLELAIADTEGFVVETMELERPGPSYAVDTLAEFTRRYNDYELTFLLGTDALLDLPNWREPTRMIELALLGVADRLGERLGPETLDALLPDLAKRVRWVEMPRIDISATDVRERASAGRSLAYLTPPAVVQYILRHGLYR